MKNDIWTSDGKLQESSFSLIDELINGSTDEQLLGYISDAAYFLSDGDLEEFLVSFGHEDLVDKAMSEFNPRQNDRAMTQAFLEDISNNSDYDLKIIFKQILSFLGPNRVSDFIETIGL